MEFYIKKKTKMDAENQNTGIDKPVALWVCVFSLGQQVNVLCLCSSKPQNRSTEDKEGIEVISQWSHPPPTSFEEWNIL